MSKNQMPIVHSCSKAVVQRSSTILIASAFAAVTVPVIASSDYGPAIWTPACNGHWYTSGNGHKFHVVHDMEGYYLTTISYFQSCSTSASVHYCVNGKQDTSSDHAAGEITQMVLEANYAWHVCCWNTYCTGTEHEGFASNPSWYTEALYQVSAGITSHAANKFGYPMDRNHVVGHNEWKNATWTAYAGPAFGINTGCNTHTDPGPYWDWSHYMSLVGGSAHHDYLGVLNQNGLFQEKDGAYGAWHNEMGSVTSFQINGNRLGYLSGGVLFAKDGLDSGWTTQTGSGVSSFQFFGDRIGALYSDGDLLCKDGLYGSWHNEIGNVTAFQLEGDRIGVLIGGVLYAKDGIDGSWTTQTAGGVVQFQLSGDRIAVLYSNGDFQAKDGLYGSWHDEIGGVSSMYINGNRIGAIIGGVLYAKDGLDGSWTTQTGAGVTKIQLCGDRIAALYSDGDLQCKDGLYGSWHNEIGGVSAFQLEGDRIAVLQSGMVTLKYGLDGSWINQTAATVTSFQLTSSTQ